MSGLAAEPNGSARLSDPEALHIGARGDPQLKVTHGGGTIKLWRLLTGLSQMPGPTLSHGRLLPSTALPHIRQGSASQVWYCTVSSRQGPLLLVRSATCRMRLRVPLLPHDCEHGDQSAHALSHGATEEGRTRSGGEGKGTGGRWDECCGLGGYPHRMVQAFA